MYYASPSMYGKSFLMRNERRCRHIKFNFLWQFVLLESRFWAPKFLSWIKRRRPFALAIRRVSMSWKVSELTDRNACMSYEKSSEYFKIRISNSTLSRLVYRWDIKYSSLIQRYLNNTLDAYCKLSIYISWSWWIWNKEPGKFSGPYFQSPYLQYYSWDIILVKQRV